MNASQPVSGKRVAELSAAELLEEAVRRFGELGWTSGRWRIELVVEAGVVTRLEPLVWDDPPMRTKIGRRELARR